MKNCVTNIVLLFLLQKVKTQQQNLNIKTLAGARIWTRDLLHPKRMRYICTTESTENVDCGQAI